MEGIRGVIRRAAQSPKKKGSKAAHLPGIETSEAAKERHIHSEAHALAAEISAYFGERKKFGAYLGVIRRMGVANARSLFASIKTEHGNVRNPRKFFMWMSGLAKPAKPAKRPGKKPKSKQLDMNDFLG